jgi:S-adenosylmethionine synthetase
LLSLRMRRIYGAWVKSLNNCAKEGMIDHLLLRQPIFCKSAVYGHLGRDDIDFTWERVDAIDELRTKAT